MVDYVLEGGKWSNKTITYSFAEYNYVGNYSDNTTYTDTLVYTSYINDTTYQATIRNSIVKWSDIADIKFVEQTDVKNASSTSSAFDVSASANIRIGFTEYSYGLGETALKYDSSGNFDNDIQIGISDPNSSNDGYPQIWFNDGGKALAYVALHEMGHALGLGHSNDPYSVMYPSGDNLNWNFDFTDVAGIQSLYGAKSDAKYYVQDLTTGDTAYLKGETYSGPLDGLLKDELIIGSTTTENTIEITSDMLNITSTGPSAFIHTGSNKDAIDVSASTGSLNVMDGGGESNFLKGSTTGRNVAYVDDRSSTPTDIWSTLANAHGGDDFIIWGITDADFKTYGQWADNQGAGGYTGLTFHMSKDGGVHYASATLSGYSTADLQSGKVSYSFGTTSDGNNYMDIKIGTTVQS